MLFSLKKGNAVMKLKFKLIASLSLIGIVAGGISIAISKPSKVKPTFATYTNGDATTYYSGVSDSLSGESLLSSLRSLNSSKRKSTVGYSSMGTTPSGQFKYTDYVLSSVKYDSNGQPYGEQIVSFYSGNATTSFNREHVWPNSHGGNVIENDIHMPRPTIASENGSRGNSFYVEGKCSGTAGWDPAMESFGDATYRGDSARIIFYCMLVDTRLSLIEADSHSTSNSNKDYMMGKLSDLIKWNINYPVLDREQRRNEGAEYLQGNRNPFIDHPEYACKIWGDSNATTQSLCANATYPSVAHTAGIRIDDGYSVASTNTTAYTLAIGDSVNFLPFVDGAHNASVSWNLSDYTVASSQYYGRSTYTNGVTITGLTAGTTTLSLSYSYDDNGETKYATAQVIITVSSSGSSGEGGDSGGTAEGVENITNATYTVSATNSVNKTGTAPATSSATYSQTYGTVNQITSGKNAILTLSGYDGKVITGIKLNMKSNGSSGAGSLTVNAGSTSLASTSGSFNTWYDNTSYGTNYRDVTVTLTNDSHIIGTGENVVITITGSTNSLYINSYTIYYGTPTSGSGGQEEDVVLTSISASGMTQNYTVGDTFSFDGILTAHYSDGNAEAVVPDEVTSPDMTTSGNKTITLTYSEDDVTKTTSYVIYVSEPVAVKTLSSIAITTNPKSTFSIDDDFVFDGVVTATYSDSTQANVTASCTFSGYNMSVAGNYTVTVSYTYGGTTKTTSYSITVASSGGSGGGESEDFSGTYNVSNQGTGSGKTWTLSDYSSQSSYLRCPESGTESVALISGIFTDKTINSNVVITINSATYGSGGNPTSSTFSVYNNDDCTSQVSATQTGTLPSSSTYTNVIYTVSLANASSFGDDLAIKITKPGKQIRLKSIDVEFSYETSGSSPVTPTSITATVNNSRVFYVGETITKNDITVKTNTNVDVTSSITFANYQFTYNDAPSGGATANKVFSITYQSLPSANLTVQVQRKAYAAPAGTQSLVHTGAEFSTAGIGSSYTTNQTVTVDGITFTVDGYIYSGKLSLSNGKTSAPGKVINTTPYPTGITNVSVSGATPDVQLSVDGSNWVNLSSATPNTVNYFYLKIYYADTSQSNYVNITQIEVTIKDSETAANVANYIMYEDTANQCDSKFDTASGYFNNMSTSERSTFMTSSDYVISTARERFEAWARHLGKTITLNNGVYEISDRLVNPVLKQGENTQIIAIIVVISFLGLSAIGGYLFLKKRKEAE